MTIGSVSVAIANDFRIATPTLHIFTNTANHMAEAGATAKSAHAGEMMDRLERQGIVGFGYVFPGQRHVLAFKDRKIPIEMRIIVVPSLSTEHSAALG